MPSIRLISVFIFLFLVSTVSAEWIKPVSVIEYTAQDASYPVTNFIDGSTGTQWAEPAGGADYDGYEWMVLVDLGSVKKINALRIYTKPLYGGAPCKIGIVKVCDDVGCVGEEDLLSSDGASWSDNVYMWINVTFTPTVGRYVRVAGGATHYGVCNSLSSQALVKAYELNFLEIPLVELDVNLPENTNYRNMSAIPVNMSIYNDNIAVLNITINNIDDGVNNISLFDDSLLAFFDFEESLTDDHSSYDRTAHLNGTIVSVAGKYGNGSKITIGATKAGTEIEDNLLSETENEATLSAWINVNPSALNGNNGIITIGGVNAEPYISSGMYLFNPGGGYVIRARVGDYNSTSGLYQRWECTPSFDRLGEWVYVTMTYNNDNIKVYYDGVLQETCPINIMNRTRVVKSRLVSGDCDSGGLFCSSNTVLGSWLISHASRSDLNGTIDNVGIWGRVLSDSEIKNLYQTNLKWNNDTYWTLYGDLDINVSGNINEGDDVNLTFTSCYTDNIFCVNESRLLSIAASPSQVSVQLVNQPENTFSVKYSQPFNLTANVTCLNDDCGNISLSFDPKSYIVEVYDTVGSFNWTSPEGVEEVEVLVIAGGGAGSTSSGNGGGGGGAGGLIYNTSYSVIPGSNYSIVVGDGGIGGSLGTNGRNSSFDNLLAIGGGAGGSGSTVRSGGSGGGAARDANKAGGTGIGGQGYNGGASIAGSWGSAGGGGGAGAIGFNGSIDNVGISGTYARGGIGRVINITGSDVYYAGGGGGAWAKGSAYAAGGLGGGGHGSSETVTVATNGTDGLGGGGGGAKVTAGDGGSGIVIIKYLNATSKGLIPVGSGSPFYMNSSNPVIVQNMTENESRLVTVWVNTTSINDDYYRFFAYANLTSNMSISSLSSSYYVNIIGNVNVDIVNQPESIFSVYRDKFFNFTANVTCFNATCGNISLSFDPKSYVVEVYDTVGSFNWTAPDGIEEVEVLVVAGGGAGSTAGGNGGGAGGAGGLNYNISYSVIPGNNYSIVVGDGGVAGAQGTNGENSSFDSINVVGGGAGGGSIIAAGRSGGSGGGAKRDGNTAGASGISGQGYNGGASITGSWGSAGGGGGSGAVGYDGGIDSGSISGTYAQGGIGRVINITGSDVYYAGGGGGAWAKGSAYAAGGLGGGGHGSSETVTVAASGTDGLGGGGGGAKVTAGDGGSGIVIIKYLNATSKGLIPVGSGYPFYMNSSNSVIVQNMTENESRLITAWINATGTGDDYYRFFAYANFSSNMNVNSVSSSYFVNIISGGVTPLISMTAPLTGCSYLQGCDAGAECVECEYPFFYTNKFIEYNVTPFGQNQTFAFWNVTNIGDVSVNVSISLNQTSFSQIKLKAAKAYEYNEHVCSYSYDPPDGCIYIMNQTPMVIATNVTPGESLDIWLWTDFVGVPGGTQVRRNVSLEAVIFSS